MTADGKYLVNDPMYAQGAVPMTKEQLLVFTDKLPTVTIVGATPEMLVAAQHDE